MLFEHSLCSPSAAQPLPERMKEAGLKFINQHSKIPSERKAQHVD